MYTQGFDCESISFKKSVNMFEKMDIAESIYEGVVEPSYKNLLGQTPTVLVTSVIIEDTTPCQIITLRWAKALASTEKNM